MRAERQKDGRRTQGAEAHADDAMTESRARWWAAERQRGKLSVIWRFGVLRFGLSMFVFFVVTGYRRHPDQLWSLVATNAVTCLLGGILFGFVLWHIWERQYSEFATPSPRRSRERVQRVLAWIGGIVVALVLATLAAMAYVGPRLDGEAQAYVEQSLPGVVARWNTDDLIAQASPEFLDAMPAAKLVAFYRTCAERLGRLKGVQGVKGTVVDSWSFPWSFTARGQFVADVQFEKAPARITVGTVRRHGEWRYTLLGVQSDAFLSSGQSLACRYVVPDPPRPRPVYLLDLGTQPTVSADELAAFCHDKLHLAAERLSPLPADGVTEDSQRHQLIAEDVITLLHQQHPELVANPDAILIVITDRDMYVRRLSWRFAFAERRDDQVVVISTARLNPTFFGAREDRTALWLRTTKVLQRELAALYYRLPSNDDPASLLHGSVPSVEALDHLPCAFSAAELERIGRHPSAGPKGSGLTRRDSHLG
jgi:hypothetical protein